MDALEIGGEPVDPLQAPFGFGNTRIARIGRPLRRRGGVHDLPTQRCTIRGILSQQPMQQGGARPGQAHNEERADNALLRYTGRALPVILQMEAVDEQPQGILTDRQASQNIESGFVFTALQQELQRLPKRNRAEVIQPRVLARRIQQLVRVEAHQRHAETLPHVAAQIQGAQPQRPAGMVMACRLDMLSVAWCHRNHSLIVLSVRCNWV